MMYLYVIIIFGVLVQALPTQFQKDLKLKYINYSPFSGECIVNISSLTEPQPSLVIDGKLIAPFGNSESFQFSENTKIVASCFGGNNALVHPSAVKQLSSVDLICGSDSFTATEWLGDSEVKLDEVKCLKHSPWIEEKEDSCANGQGFNIAVGVQALSPHKIDVYKSCFDEYNASVLYVKYSQSPESIKSQKADRPDFKQGIWYPNLSVNTLYTKNTQKINVAYVVGEAMADVYYNVTYLARGHLAAKADFVLSTEQRATFNYINCVPQWQSFNDKNWAKLEDNLRSRISDGSFKTTIYTGSWGILQLKDSANNLHDIYLSPRTNKLPAPLWLFKVVHDASTNRATAFLGLNNPFVTLEEAKRLTFCKDECLNNNNFNWLKWKAEDTTAGYSICCNVNEFRKVVDYLPKFEVNELFY